jgi:hypothetical protein
MIQEKLEHLERGSLLNKVDLLFQLCKPPKDDVLINNYVYDRERLQKIDDARHSVIHRNSMGLPIPDIDGDLDFISRTANYLMALVNHKYGVRLDVAKVFNLRIPPEILQS